ncbi:MAG: hypothetical protein AB7T07_14560 [Steroidobacteraceae bacterium]
MRSIEVDDEVYKLLEGKVQSFGDSPNLVLKRLLGIELPATALPTPQSPLSRSPVRKHKRGKAPKTNLRDLIRVGSLSEGQVLFMHDYQGNKISGVQAIIRGNDLEYKGNMYSMSALALKHMKSQGYDSNSYRGPQFWYTAQGKSVKELWDEYLKAL